MWYSFETPRGTIRPFWYCSINCLTITPLQSLVLTFCYPSLRTTPLWWPVISSFYLRLSRRSFVIFLFLSLILISLPSWVLLARCLFDGAQPSFDRSGHGLWRWLLLQPLPFHPPLLPFLQVVVWRLRPLWHSLSALILTLIHSLLSCISEHPC